MNILTFDIEEWALAESRGLGSASLYAEYDDCLNRILDLLDARGIKATFFCVGSLVPNHAYVIRMIADRGHEIGCHSNHHHFLNKMTFGEVYEDTKKAVDSIEQVVGKKVLSYRAPAFSIGDSNKWAFDILAECGIERDASVYPAVRDYGGFPNFASDVPCLVSHNGHSIKEFPICMTSLFGKDVAYSGGGYFRFFPFAFIRAHMTKSNYTMTYFHLDDLIPRLKSVKSRVKSRKEYEEYFKEKGTFINRYRRFAKANFGRKGAFRKMTHLVEQTSFINLETADAQIDWEKAFHIRL